MKGLILALQFLTRFPIPIEVEFNEKNLASSIFFFPIVSGLIGFFVGLVVFLIHPLSPGVAALMGLILWILLNGGLHMDGLADMFDGFLSNREKEDTLKIMRDSRLGSFGALALILVIVGKIILLQSIDSLGPASMALVLVAARLGVLCSMAFFPSARPGGLGDMFQTRSLGKKVYVLMFFYGLFFYLYRPSFLLLLLTGIFTSILISRWSMKKISGVSGDIFGAIMELGEVFVLLVYWGVDQWNFF